MIKLEDRFGRSVWINAADVQMVQPYIEGRTVSGSMVTMRSNPEPIRVLINPEELLRAMGWLNLGQPHTDVAKIVDAEYARVLKVIEDAHKNGHSMNNLHAEIRQLRLEYK